MDVQSICNALKMTMVGETSKQGEATLNEMHKIFGFTPSLLKIVLEPGVEDGVRMAASIFFKNNITAYWAVSKTDEACSDYFFIHENDKSVIKDNIVEAICSVPGPLQVHIKTALQCIIKSDYPDQFPQLIEKLKAHLSVSDYNSLNGALLALHALCKNFEFCKSNKWLQLDYVMREFLPPLTTMMHHLLQEKSDESCSLQKLVLKCLSTYISFNFPVETLNKEIFPSWVNICCTILEDYYKDDDYSEGVYWKTKKWAVNILAKVFSRYGNPGFVEKKYKEFSEYFLKSFTHEILHTLMKICEMYRIKKFVAPRVLSGCLHFFSTSLCQAYSWKVIRSYFSVVIESIVHPLLCFNDEDEELWEEDPNEYIRYRAVEFAELGAESNPNDVAYTLLEDACEKRKGILSQTMEFCIRVLISNSATEREKDGSLHMIGAISSLLLKRKGYKNQLEAFLVNHVIPTLRSQTRFRRARACWLMGKLSSAEFQDSAILCQATDVIRQLMFEDPELPVQTMAAMALIDCCEQQEKVEEFLKPHITVLITKLIDLLRLTEFDELSSVIERIVDIYRDDMHDVASQLIGQLCSTLVEVMKFNQAAGDEQKEDDDEDEQDADYRAMVGDGIIGNIESILIACSDHQEILDVCEPHFTLVVQEVLKHQSVDLYSSVMNVLEVMLTNKISPGLWQVYDWIYLAFKNGLDEFFLDIVAVLHKFITVDPEAFISDIRKVEMASEMCIKILNDDELSNEDPARAAKLLEVMLLNYGAKIVNYMAKFVEAALTRLSRNEEKMYELHCMCLQVVNAALFTNPHFVLEMLCKHHWPASNEPILDRFIKAWLENTKYVFGLHDRRLYVLVTCTLLSLPADSRPAIISSFHNDYMPQLLHLMQKLPDAYACKAKLDEEDESTESADSNDEADDERNVDEGMASDEDAIDDESAKYLELLEKVEENDADHWNNALEKDGDDFDDDCDLTELEAFETVLEKDEHEKEEYIVFFQTMTELERVQPEWYHSLMANLDDTQKVQLKTIADTALKCIQQRESKRIEQAGGYGFTQTSVPSNFNFGSQ